MKRLVPNLTMTLLIAVLVLTAIAHSNAEDRPSSGASLLLMSDTQIDQVTSIAQAHGLLKQYAQYIRQVPEDQNTARMAATQELHSFKMATLGRDLMLATFANLALDLVDGQQDQIKQAHDASSACHDLANVQSAVTGGFTLAPAAYGKTYLGIAGLIAPFFFSRCETNQPFVIPKDPQTRQMFRDSVDQIRAEFDAESKFLQVRGR